METNQDFIWTDELVSDFYEHYTNGERTMADALKTFKEMKHPTLPQPILTTEEGDKKYEGDYVCAVNLEDFDIICGRLDTVGEFDKHKYFNTRQAAKTFQLLARLNDIHEQCDALHKKGIEYINEYNK